MIFCAECGIKPVEEEGDLCAECESFYEDYLDDDYDDDWEDIDYWDDLGEEHF